MRLVLPPECVEPLKRLRTSGDYLADVAADFATMEPHLPESVASIVDIGCGLAGIDVLLKRRFPDAMLALLDGDGERTNYYWDEQSPAYGSREATEAFLAANDTKADRWIEAGTKEVISADLIVSTLAWGFHFPLSTYKVNGFCIADLRIGSEKQRGKVIQEAMKHKRCVFQCEQ